ncbi:MAG: hypothetical protein H7X84_04970 [Verrucomicrobia bacterium]|nr:hypothetical protein [Prolixibacteraceae bacterium]
MSYLKHTLTLVLTIMLMTAWADEDHLNCFTDRDVYVSGDQIRINVLMPVKSNSKTLYVDLSGFSGKTICGVKLKVENHRAEGTLQIPDSLKTGTYLLRSFYNQNHHKELFIRDLMIANRFEDFSEGFNRSMNKLEGKLPVSKLDLELSVPDTIERRSKAMLKLKFTPDQLQQIEGGLSVSIARQVKDFQSGEEYFTQQLQANESPISEDHGLVVSGKVINKTSGLSVADATVYLSVPDSIPGFQYAVTDRTGSFNFLMKEVYGMIPVVIQAVKEKETDQLKVVADEKFNFKNPLFTSIQTKKYENAGEQMKGMVESFTFSKIFSSGEVATDKLPFKNDKTSPLFYGEPNYVIRPDEFYDLKNFTEISRELLIGVKFRDKNENLSLNLMDFERGEYFDEQAFVLVDGVPVQDMKIIQNMGTSAIDWIHSVLEYRFYGDIGLPGVIAIGTNEEGLKWLKESDRLLKFNYEGLQVKEKQKEPAVSAHHPDLRSLLIWEPNQEPSAEMEFEFKSSDISGDYKISVTGKKKNGEVFQSERIIHIN